MDIHDCRGTFLDFISEIKDHRVDRSKVHPVAEIFLVTLSAVICGAEGWDDIENFGEVKLDFLRQYLPFTHGIPSDDTLRRFFRALDPGHFQACFTRWMQTFQQGEVSHIAIDGKVSRHTFDGEGNPLHMVSAFASELRLVLGQEKVADKSNEIKAIPYLLDTLDLAGSVVTIDAMGTQREISAQICAQKADYILALKGNQGTLSDDVKRVFEDDVLLKELNIQAFQTVDGDHGRIEERTYKVIACPEILKKHHEWPGLESLIEVESMREVKGKRSFEKRRYITSLAPEAAKIAFFVRAHWAIENSLHWILDISFRDDESRIRKGNAPQNMAIIKHVALNVLQKIKGKRETIKRLRKAAGWSDQRLQEILATAF